MSEKFIKILDTVIFLIIAVLAFLLPVFFLTATAEFYQFPKNLILEIGAAAALLAWAVKLFLTKKIVIRRTPLDLPLIIFAAIYILATLASSDRFVSIFGYYPTFLGGSFEVLATVILYFVFVSNIGKAGQILKILGSFIASVTILALMAVLKFFQVEFFQVAPFNLPGFTPAGSFNNLAIFAAVALLLNTGLLLFFKETGVKVIILLSSLFLFFSFSLINSLPAWVILAAGIAILALILVKTGVEPQQKTFLAAQTIIVVLLALLAFLPASQNSILAVASGREDFQFFPKEVQLPYLAGWNIATGAISAKPVFGFGPSTFFYSATQFKPIWLNQTAVWSLRFDKSSSEIFRLLAETGILGFLAYLFLIFAIVKLLLKTHNSLLTPAVAGIVLATILAPAAAAIYFMFFILAASLASWQPAETAEVEVKVIAVAGGKFQVASNVVNLIFVITAAGIFLAVLFFSFRQTVGEIFYRRALLAAADNRTLEAVANLRSAIGANAGRDVYSRTLSQVFFSQAVSTSQKPDQTDQDKANVRNLVTGAVNLGKITAGYQTAPTAGTSNLNVNNWENLANLYFQLINQVQGAQNHAIATYLAATRLDGANPRVWENLAKIYARAARTEDAIRAYETAIGAKLDYAPAYYNLAQVLKGKAGEEARVVRELETFLVLVPPGFADRLRVEGELEEAKTKVPPEQRPPAAAQPGLPQVATPSATRSAR